MIKKKFKSRLLIIGNLMDDKKILMIIADKDFRDEEYSNPRDIFENEGIEVKVTNSTGEQSEGSQGLIVEPEMNNMQVTATDYDAIVIVGGTGAAEEYFSDQTVLQIVRDAYQSGKIVAAICVSPLILANAGILRNKKVTGSYSVKNALQKSGAIYFDQPVITDMKIITGRDPESSENFGHAIVNALGIEKND
jgi:protease I